MLELRAVAGVDVDVPFESGLSPRNPSTDSAGMRSTEIRQGPVWMMTESDGPVDCGASHVGRVTVVFRGELLGGGRKTLKEPEKYVASLYERQGDDFAVSLRGSFAIILYDHSTNTLKAWTDHFGVETLVYSECRDRIAVATSLHALLPLLPEAPSIDPAAVHEYLQYSCIPTPRTIYEGVFKLPPGCRLERRRETTITPYWDMSYRGAGVRTQSEDAWADSVLRSVRTAVSLNLTGIEDTGKAGCFLSGGTDSSSVAALIGESTGRPPNTFSIGFEDPRYNEIHYARIAAKRVQARYHEYFVTPGDILNLVHRAAQAYDEPFGNSSIIPTYFCARLAAEHGMSHLLAGDGGDELFGGNSRYVSDQVFQRYARIPGWVRRHIIEPMIAVAPHKTRFMRRAASYVRRSNIPAPERYFSYSLVSSFAPEELFTGDFLRFASENDSLAPARRHWSAADAEDDLNRWLYVDLKIIITDNDLRKVTTMSRLAGIQPRYPLLEPSLAELTGSIPPDLKVRGSQLRYLFKRAMRDVLPPEIIKKSKHGFGLPFSVWVGEHKPLHDLAFDVLGSAQCRQRGYFRPGILEWLWSQYQNVHRPYYGDLLWVFMMLELWHINHGSNWQTAGSDTLQPARQRL